MTSNDWLERALGQGRLFQERVLALEAEKSELTLDELTVRLNDCVSDFTRSAAIDLSPRIAFGDVRALSVHGSRCHLQMAHVVLDGRHCILYFDTSFKEGSNKLVFIARSWVLLVLLAVVLRDGQSIQVEFALETGDNGYLGDLAFCSKNPAGCLIPDPDFAATNGYAAFREICAASIPPWAERSPKIFWRGSTTGHRLWNPPEDGQPDDLRWLARLALCLACREAEVADICDVGIANLVQLPEPHLQARIRASGLMRDPVPRALFFKNRAAFDIDGNSNAWSGLFCSLLGGSCVFKVASRDGYRQWYYDHLRPWDNYVPIEADLRDLPKAVAWFRENQGEAEHIADRGRRLALGMTATTAMRQSAVAFERWLARKN